jgi:kynurenine 3-monooxygenase
MLIALPNIDGSFTATLFLPATGASSFATLDSPRAVTDFFARCFSDALPLIPDLEEDFFSHPTGTMVTVRCAPWHVGGKLLLIGDAAHGIVPFHGQGMNCAFEDCARFDELLDHHQRWDELFARFEDDRKPNADAIATMALENYIEMRDTVRDPKFMLRKELSFELERRLPDRFIPRYSMVMFHHEIPYRIAYDRGQVQAAILEELTGQASSLADIRPERMDAEVRSRLDPLIPSPASAGEG